MSDKVYMPPRPDNPYDDCPCPPPPPVDPCFSYPQQPQPPFCPPPPPPVVKPECNSWKPSPGFHQINPIPKVEEGQSLYEAMNNSIQRVNACISQWNYISKNCFAAMNACVEAARSNDVYYDDCEVHYQEGFDENEGCAYAIIEKKSVDRQGRPIFVRLVPAYNNTTNSGVKQDIFDVSFIESANVIITAVPVQQDNWYGPALYKGAAIPSIDQSMIHPIEGQDPQPEMYHPGWVYGFNRQGWLRIFKGKDVTTSVLCQNGMVDVIGSCWPILIDGAVTEEAEELVNKANIQAIGFNKGTGSVFFFSCSAQDQPGMSGIAVAKLLQGFGCTTAVITSLILADDKSTDSAAMMYMGQMSTVPQAGRSPENLAYWVITKRPDFNNRFQKEIADLVQTTGQNAWKNYLLGVQIQDFDDRIIQNEKDIKDEVERAMAAEAQLQQNIDAEVDRATQAEQQLQDNIDAEVERAQNEEARLDAKIDAETNRAEAAEANLHQEILDETARATAAENQNAAAIAAEKLRAQTRENEIQAALDKEIRERIAADNDIINALEQEVLARRAADTALQNAIDATKNELKIDINNINSTIAGITGGQTNLPYLKLTGGIMTGPISFSSTDTITVGRGPTQNLEVATKQYVDDAVSAGGGGGTGGDVSKEYVDQQITSLQTQLTDKVSKTGDTMTGALNMDGQQIQNAVLSSNTGTSLDDGAGGPGKLTNLADPVNPTDAVNLQSLNTAISDAKTDLSGDFLPTAGGNMTGDINMTDSSVINFYDAEAVQAAMDKPVATASSTAINLRPSKVAKQFGITAELLKSAQEKGLNVTESTVAQTFDVLGINRAAIIPGQAIKGSVYNDSNDMCVKAEIGKVGLKGSGVSLSDGSGNDIPISGVSTIGTAINPLVKLSETDVQIVGPLNVTNTVGDATGTINAGKVGVGDVILEPHTDDTNDTHLDIDVPTSKGAVFINRSENGNSVAGGTGELHVTEIHAPNELVLRPGTTINANGSRIVNVGKAVNDNDAVILSQIPQIKPTSPNQPILVQANDGNVVKLVPKVIANNAIVDGKDPSNGIKIVLRSTAGEIFGIFHGYLNNGESAVYFLPNGYYTITSISPGTSNGYVEVTNTLLIAINNSGISGLIDQLFRLFETIAYTSLYSNHILGNAIVNDSDLASFAAANYRVNKTIVPFNEDNNPTPPPTPSDGSPSQELIALGVPSNYRKAAEWKTGDNITGVNTNMIMPRGEIDDYFFKNNDVYIVMYYGNKPKKSTAVPTGQSADCGYIPYFGYSGPKVLCNNTSGFVSAITFTLQSHETDHGVSMGTDANKAHIELWAKPSSNWNVNATVGQGSFVRNNA